MKYLLLAMLLSSCTISINPPLDAMVGTVMCTQDKMAYKILKARSFEEDSTIKLIMVRSIPDDSKCQ